MSFLVRNAVLLAKLETAYGVNPGLEAAHAILVRSLQITPQQAEFASRDLLRPFYGASEQLPTAVSAQVEMEVELQGSGTAGKVPGYGLLLRGSGFSETITPGTSVVYAPISEAFESAALLYSVRGEDGTRIVHTLLGARGTVAFTLNAKAIPVMKFRFLALYTAVRDDNTPLTADFSLFQTPLPVNAANTPTCLLHGINCEASEFSLDVANTLVYRSLIGGESVKLTDRKASGKMVFEATSVATKNWWEIARSATLGEMRLVHGIEAGKIVEIHSARTQISNPQYKEQNGIAMLEMTTSLVPSSAGNDEMTLTLR